jgi:hypothetical protein
LLAAALAACASNPPSNPSHVAGTAQALAVVDCQNTAAQCLGVLPSQDKIKSCREEIKGCIDQLQMDAQQKATELGACVSDAQSCVQGAETFGDAMTCRQGFEDCAGTAVDLTDLPAAPQFPMLPPEVGAALDGAGKCSQDALSCVKAGSSSSDIASCADTYRACVIALLPEGSGELPKLPPEIAAALDGAKTCGQDALSCVKAGSSASDIASCADAYRGCVTDLLPTQSGGASVEVPTLPPEIAAALDGAKKCSQDALSCVKAGSSSSDIASCADTYRGCVIALLPEGSGELPGLPIVPGEGADCLNDLGQCIKGGTSPATCATQARSCIGLPALTLPTLPGLPKPKQP